MENTYKFDLVQVFTSDIKLDSTNDKLVKSIEFSIIGYKEDQNTFIIEEVEIPNVSNNLIPYNKLDKDTMLNWVIEFLGDKKIAQIKAELDKELDKMVNHFNQFKDSNQEDLIKATLPPYVNQEIPKGAISLLPKEITEAILLK
jgi:hypothetical protein